MAGLAAHGCGPNGSTTSLVLACRMLRAVQNPCRHIIVLPSTGLPPPWQFVCAESNTRIQSLTSRCAQLSPRWVCCVSNIISYAQRATVRIHLHNQISCSLDGSVTSLACRMRRAIHLWHAIRAELFIPMLTRARHGGSHAALAGSLTSLACRARRAIHSNAHPCAARWLSCSPRWVCHVSGMSYAQSYSFQCSLVHGTVAPVQPSTGLSRLWHVVCAELFIPMRTRARHGGSEFLGTFLLQLPHGIGRVASGARARIPMPRCLLWMIAKGGVLLSQVHHTLWPHSLAHSQAPQVGGSWRHILFIVASSHTGQTSSKWKSTGQSKAGLWRMQYALI